MIVYGVQQKIFLHYWEKRRDGTEDNIQNLLRAIDHKFWQCLLDKN